MCPFAYVLWYFCEGLRIILFGFIHICFIFQLLLSSSSDSSSFHSSLFLLFIIFIFTLHDHHSAVFSLLFIVFTLLRFDSCRNHDFLPRSVVAAILKTQFQSAFSRLTCFDNFTSQCLHYLLIFLFLLDFAASFRRYSL